MWCPHAGISRLSSVSGRTLQLSTELVVPNLYVPTDFLVEGQVSGLGIVHPLLTLHFFNTRFLPHEKSKTLSSVMDELRKRQMDMSTYCLDINQTGSSLVQVRLDRQSNRQPYRQIANQTDRQTDKQPDRQQVKVLLPGNAIRTLVSELPLLTNVYQLVRLTFCTDRHLLNVQHRILPATMLNFFYTRRRKNITTQHNQQSGNVAAM